MSLSKIQDISLIHWTHPGYWFELGKNTLHILKHLISWSLIINLRQQIQTLITIMISIEKESNQVWRRSLTCKISEVLEGKQISGLSSSAFIITISKTEGILNHRLQTSHWEKVFWCSCFILPRVFLKSSFYVKIY